MNLKQTVFGGMLLLAAGSVGTALAGTFPPFYADVQTEQGAFFAVRPFYSCTKVEEGEIRDFFWPLYSRKAFKDERTSRALIFWFTHEFGASGENPRCRRWLIPFYFQGRDVHGKSYAALFPAGGSIREIFGRDELSFVLFPAFGKSRINEVETTSVLWPVYSRTRGDGIQRDRVFPLYGRSILEGKYEKRFVLWPFWNSAAYFHPGDSGRAWILFPLFGRADMDTEQTLWLIPPFFRFTQGERQNRMYCPWPFIQKISDERRDRMYVWPLWGRTRHKGGVNHRTFMLWPVFWSERTESADLSRTRRLAVPLFSFQRTFQIEEGVPKDERVEMSRQWKVWPLMSWRREGENTRFRMLELWPITDSPPVERNWAPFWTLYRRTGAPGGAVQQDFLWFVWRNERVPDDGIKEWSLLRGLMAYRREGGKRSFRLFYGLRFGE